MCVLKPGHATHKFVLNVKRQAGGNAVGVVLVGSQAFGFQKNLVTFLIGKAVDFVFHTGAIARTHTLNLAGEHGATVKPAADDVVRALVGVGDPAGHLLWVHIRATHEAEYRHVGAHATRHTVTGLLQQFAEVNRTAIQSWRRACFQTSLRQLQFLEPSTQRHCRRIPCPACGIVVETHMDLAIQKGTCGEHHRPGAKLNADLRDSTHHAFARAGGLHHQVIHCLLKQPEIGLVLQHATHGGLIQNAVGLRTGGAYRRALAGVENAKLNACLVGGQCHGPAHRVHLFDQMALADAANRRIATHLSQGFNVVAQQQGFAAHARSSQCCLGSGMATTNNNDIKFLGVQHGERIRSRGRDFTA